MAKQFDYEVKTTIRLNMHNPDHVLINNVIQNLDPKIFKSKNQFILDACKFYIDNYGSETFIAKKKDNERAEYIRSADIEDIKAEVIEAAINEARKEVIRLLGGVISGMNVGQPVIMQAANSEAQEPTEDVILGDDYVASMLEGKQMRESGFFANSSDAMPALYEKMLKTSVEEPERIKDIGYVLKMVTDKDIIPDEFCELYETFCNTLKIRR